MNIKVPKIQLHSIQIEAIEWNTFLSNFLWF